MSHLFAYSAHNCEHDFILSSKSIGMRPVQSKSKYVYNHSLNRPQRRLHISGPFILLVFDAIMCLDYRYMYHKVAS